MSNSEVYLTRDEIKHPYVNLAVMLEDKRRKAEQMSKTVFARITASPEVLAEKLVYCLNSSSFRVIDSAGRLLAYENEVWGSTVLPGSFWTKYEEAYTATVAKLKEVYQ